MGNKDIQKVPFFFPLSLHRWALHPDLCMFEDEVVAKFLMRPVRSVVSNGVATGYDYFQRLDVFKSTRPKRA